MANYVLVHAAWHSGDTLHGVASLIRAKGHDVHTPTTKGNRPGDELPCLIAVTCLHEELQ